MTKQNSKDRWIVSPPGGTKGTTTKEWQVELRSLPHVTVVSTAENLAVIEAPSFTIEVVRECLGTPLHVERVPRREDS